MRARTDAAKDERRRLLQEAALDAFFDNGFRATRMDDIANRAGLSKGAIYLYFSSKEALFTSLVETYALPNVEALLAVAANASSLRAGVRGAFGVAPILVRESRVPKIIKILIGEAGQFPELATMYRRQVVDRGLAALTDLVVRSRDAGEIADCEPGMVARLVIAPVILSVVWRLAFDQDGDAPLDIEGLLSQHEQILFNGLGVKEAAA